MYIRCSPTLARIGNAPFWYVSLRLITAGSLAFAAYFTFRYINQPLIGLHAFRQTQTALTSYWMLQEGWTLAYQTPVTGYPWSIPFEFPIYQSLVAAIAALTNFDLEAVGRFISFFFLAACAWPAFAMSPRLNLPKEVPWVFCALLWSSPLNLYWGRTFMIETTALFFSLACLPFAIDVIRRKDSLKSAPLFLLFATAGVLQKSTTTAPILLFLAVAAVGFQIRSDGLSVRALHRSIYPVMILGMPLVLGLCWAYYADVVKLANPMGSQLTSKALTTWNFGTLAQRLDPGTWRLVIWKRSLVWNAGGVIGLLLLALPWLGNREHRRFGWISLGAIALFILPVLIFTNVHIVHEYYQVACVAFLLGAISIVTGAWLNRATGIVMMVPVVTLAIVISNVIVFNRAYGMAFSEALDKLDPRSVQAYRVGKYLREHTHRDTGLVVFGQDYSSEIAFQSQRKSMTVPSWFKEYRQLWETPQKYLGEIPLAAIVICPPSEDFPTQKDIDNRLQKETAWVHRNIHGCELLLAPDNITN